MNSRCNLAPPLKHAWSLQYPNFGGVHRPQMLADVLLLRDPSAAGLCAFDALAGTQRWNRPDLGDALCIVGDLIAADTRDGHLVLVDVHGRGDGTLCRDVSQAAPLSPTRIVVVIREGAERGALALLDSRSG